MRFFKRKAKPEVEPPHTTVADLIADQGSVEHVVGNPLFGTDARSEHCMCNRCLAEAMKQAARMQNAAIQAQQSSKQLAAQQVNQNPFVLICGPDGSAAGSADRLKKK